MNQISDEAIVNIINSVTEFMYCNWKYCHMENIEWDDLLELRERITSVAMDMIKENLEIFLTDEYLRSKGL